MHKLVKEVELLFPQVDTFYVKYLISQYKSRPKASILESISEKLLSTNGNYPKTVLEEPSSTKTVLEEPSSTKTVLEEPSSTKTVREPSSTGTYKNSSLVQEERQVEKWNELLLELHDIFSLVAVEELRNLVRKIKSKTLIIQELISNPSLYSTNPSVKPLREQDLFRSPNYIHQVKTKLLNDFPFHWEYTINSFMAESNNFYPDCFHTLEEYKPSKLWTTFLPFTKRSWIEFEISDPGLILEMQEMARLELDQETKQDESLALEITYDQYQKENQLITCQCCFGQVIFEELGQCRQGHLFCKDCIVRNLSIGMYDTGSLRGKEMKCMSSSPNCDSIIEFEEIKRFAPADLIANYQATLWEKMIQQSGISCVACPFCGYAEVTEPPSLFVGLASDLFDNLSENFSTIVKNTTTMALIFASIFLPFSIVIVLFLIVRLYMEKRQDHIIMDLKKYIQIPNWARKPSAVLNCKNIDCLKVSCTKCQDVWISPHKCFEKEADSLRLFVELAMSRALIRTCPSCSIRFSKIDGCNKMKCPNCKYETCYVCRKDITDQKYDHFCQHFRVLPGSECNQCSKCDLFQKERDEVAVRNAGIAAEKDWRERNPVAAKKFK